MAKSINVLQDGVQGEKPPVWASEAFSYFENIHGEQWVAKDAGDALLISGLDIDWDVIRIDSKNYKSTHSDILMRILSQKLKQPGGFRFPNIRTEDGRGIVFSSEEYFWLLGLLECRQAIQS